MLMCGRSSKSYSDVPPKTPLLGLETVLQVCRRASSCRLELNECLDGNLYHMRRLYVQLPEVRQPPENSLVRSGNLAPGVQLTYQVAGSGTLTKFCMTST